MKLASKSNSLRSTQTKFSLQVLDAWRILLNDKVLAGIELAMNA